MDIFLLESLFKRLRANRVISLIEPNTKLLDLGCGPEGVLLRKLSPRIEIGVGLDRRSKPWREGKIRVSALDIDKNPLPFTDGYFDCVTMLATLEHLENREEVVREIYRILKPNGILLITAPTWAAKPLLEFLSFRMKIVDSNHIGEHKIYFWKKELIELLSAAGFRSISHKYFQIGFNNFVHARK